MFLRQNFLNTYKKHLKTQNNFVSDKGVFYQKVYGNSSSCFEPNAKVGRLFSELGKKKRFNVLLARKFHCYFVQLLIKLAFDPIEFGCNNFQKPVKLVRLVEWFCSLLQFQAETGRLLDFSV